MAAACLPPAANHRPLLTLGIRRLTLTTVVLAFGFSSSTFLSQPFQDWRGTATYLSEHADQDEMIVTYPRWHNTSLAYYAGRPLAERAIFPASAWPPGEPVPFAPASEVWVVVDSHPTTADDTAGLWSRSDQAGELISRAYFPSYVEVRRYRIR